MSTPLTTAQRLGQRLQELSETIEDLRKADMEAVTARHVADVEEWKEFLKAQGSVEQRKITAKLSTERLAFDADVKEARVRHLVRQVRERDKRVEVGRTFSADMRAELSVMGRDGTP